ncbi:MAG: peptide chain release factor N(5)-glutamine methyltransferase, partial [Dehalococcoidia bacterium]|nr:peptide chain release factor N(5)-glutamine methyltransferase [Dehalococcoidia bacterium]
SDLAFALGGVDVIVANLPYVPSATIATLAREVRDREPLLAFDGGVDGLDLIRRLIDDCATRLRPRLLALECDPEQAHPISEALLNGGAHDVAVQKDFASRDRVVTGRWGREA